jgi:hypothetical protein
LPDTEVEFVVVGQAVRIVKARRSKKPTRGARATERLRGSAKGVSMSTDEILALTRGER